MSRTKHHHDKRYKSDLWSVGDCLYHKNSDAYFKNAYGKKVWRKNVRLEDKIVVDEQLDAYYNEFLIDEE